MAGKFPIFCHIGDYGPHLYHNLESLIAISDPLVLWTPSASMLERYESPVTVRRVLSYLESGHIKIIGRRPWLTDPSFRRRSSWEGAAWCRGFDDLIGAMGVRDENKVLDYRRVIFAPPERGFEKATELLEKQPHLQATISDSIEKRQMPPGTLMKALHRRETQNHAAAVQSVLRDAINHHDAVCLAGARAPVLRPEEGAFIGLMEVAADPSCGGLEGTVPARERDKAAVELIESALRVTEALEPLERAGHLDDFLKSAGRVELLDFLGQILDGCAENSARPFLDALQLEIRAGFSPAGILPGDRLDRFASVAGLALAAIAAIPGLTAVAVGGLVASAFPVGRGLLRKAGVLRPDYRGPLWPFLWHNGRPPTARQLSAILTRLRELKIEITASD